MFDSVSGAIAARYAVNKYPTLKIFRYGELVRKEYRGQRSSDALLNFIREQLRNTVQVIQHAEELEGLDVGSLLTDLHDC